MEFKNLITLTQVSDGAPGDPGAPGRDAGGYFIESNVEEIYYFITQKGYESNIYELEISLYKLPLEDNLESIDFSKDFSFSFEIAGTKREFANDENYISFGKIVTEEVNGEKIEQEIQGNTMFFAFSRFLEEYKNNLKNIVFKFYCKIDEIEILKVFPLSLGTSDQMAQFEVTATKINAAVNNSFLEFTNQGLDIYNAGLRIYDQKAKYSQVAIDEEFDNFKKYYEYNVENNIYIETTDSQFMEGKTYYEYIPANLNFGVKNGNLFLRGEIEATSGSFTGIINATDARFEKGQIGGFEINGTSLTSNKKFYSETKDQILQNNKKYYKKENGEYILSTDSSFQDGKIYYEQFPFILLSGEAGLIQAQKIVLGQEASIESYIKLGEDTFIYNPQYSGANGAIIRSGSISIKDNGVANFGGIKVDGKNSKIYAIDEKDPEGLVESWSITPNKAIFNNIIVKGAIKTGVFEAETTQAAGGAMLFMASYKIEAFKNLEEKVEVVLDQNIENKISVNSTVWLINENNQYEENTVIDIEQNKLYLKNRLSFNNYIALINVGVTENFKPLIMGINSGDSSININNQQIVYGRGLTIKEYGSTNLPNLFLGDLSTLGSSYNGYGLYSNNVFLNGTLTTKIGQNSYAGINTLTGKEANKFTNWIDNSKIVFWAGAQEIGLEDEANFQVTENGSVYATRAHLTNSIFAGGDIRGADLYTARIHGDDINGALTIYNTAANENKGIVFKSKSQNDSDEITTFLIGSDGLKTEARSFIEINKKDTNEEIVFIGDKIRTTGAANYLSIETINNVPVLYHKHSNDQFCGFYFDEGKTTYQITTFSNESQTNYRKLILDKEKIEFLEDVKLSSSSTNETMQYRPVNGGYDLYITSEEVRE